MKKTNFLKTLLVAVGLCAGMSNAWAETTVGTTDNTTGYLGAKSDAYAINSNGTWTFNFTNYNSGSGNVWNNFLLECNNGTNDEFVVRADSWEVVRGANADFTSNYAGSNLVTDLNGASVAMTVTRNGNQIVMDATITPTTGVEAYNYTYTFKRASGSLNLYLSVDNSYLTIQSASWAAASGTITETEVVNCDFESSETLFTATDGTDNDITISNVKNELSNTTNVLSLATPNKNTNYAKYDFSSLVADASLVKVSFDCLIPSSSANYGEYISIGDAAKRTDPEINGSSNRTYVSTGAIFNVANLRSKNGGSTNYDWFSVNNTCIDHGTDPAHLGVWLHVECMVDLVNSLNSYKVMSYDRTATYASGYDVAFLNASAAACSQIDVFKATNNKTTAYIDNIVVTKYVDTSVTPTTYTIKYEDTEGTTIKTSREGDTYVGSSFTATSEDMATFYSADASKKYVYKSGNTEKDATATATDNVITLVFDTYNKYHYALTKSYGATNDVVEGDEYSDATKTVYYPICIKDGSDYYTIDANASEPYFGYTFTSADLTKTVTYSIDEDIIYYSEFEDAATGTASYEYFSATSSNGTSKALSGSNTMITAMNLASDGVYNISMAGGNRDAGHTTTLEIKLKAADESISSENVISQYFAGGQWIGNISVNATIPAGSELYLTNDNGTGTGKFAGDYIIVRKINNPSVTVTSAGMATYVNNDYDLDFSGTEIKAYKVKVESAGTAKLTEVENVPAGTPVLLVKDGGKTESIPVMIGATAVSGNDLVAGTGAAVATDDGGYTNMILNNGTSGIGFYYANGQIVAANRAYLHFDSSLKPTGARMALVFDDDTVTSINEEVSVKNEESAAAVYDLQGRRVAQPAKGLYIMNGKKVVVK